MATFTSGSAAETQQFGRDFAARVGPCSVIALRGDLGAGKTQFVKGFVDGLGSSAEVTSPTFTLVHEYSGGRRPVYHFDFFRIENVDAAEALGLDDYFEGDGVCVVEWADRFPQVIPSDAQWIEFGVESENVRTIALK